MLVLTRKINERIVIGGSVVLTVVRVNGSAVSVGIEAPREVTVVREELRFPADGADDGRRRTAAI